MGKTKWMLGWLLVVGLIAQDAHAWTTTITAGTRSMYLRVGTGSTSGLNFNSGGTMRNNTTVDTVSVTVPAAQVGSGNAVAMASDSGQGISHYEGYAFCNAPAQVYVGGYFRRPTSSATAILTATAPANLVNQSGQTIPFSQISWTASGNGDGTAAQPIPAGTFAGGAQTLASFQVNTWRESCHTFSYANDDVVAAGTYEGRVIYTLSAP